MTYYDSSGTKLTKTSLLALTEEVDDDPKVRFTADVYEAYTAGEGAGGYEKANRLAYTTGQVVRVADLNAKFKTATFASITPNHGAAAGGTNVTIKGARLSGSSGATLGGNALTNFKVVDDTTITGTAPAHAAGAVNLVIADDAGNVTANNAYTYDA